MKQTPVLFDYKPPQAPWLDVVYVDDDLLVLNKPSGLLSVPGKGEHLKDSIQSRAQAEYPTATTIHRLDMETSGIIIMALNKAAHRHVGLQFERRHLSKTYHARLFGVVKEDKGRVDLPLICDWPNRPKQMVDHELGKKAVTDWEVIEREEDATRVAFYPQTGRSHQLRVHAREMGHPILCDPFYGCEVSQAAADRLQLHATSLTLRHPVGGREITFDAPVPF